MLKKLALAVGFTVALLSTAMPASALQYWYNYDNVGNSRVNIFNDSPYMLYCSIRSSTGAWSDASIPPGYTYWFNIWGQHNSYWNCWH